MLNKRNKAEILKEIARVEVALLHTKSNHLRRDYEKYLKKLRIEYRRANG
jgi:hypothetical protein